MPTMVKLCVWFVACWLVARLAQADNITVSDQCAVQLQQQQTYYEDILLTYKTQCTSRPLRILAPSTFTDWISRQAAQFEELVGISVNMTFKDYFRIPSLIDLQLSDWAQQDVWMVDGASLPYLAYRNALLPLDNCIEANAAVGWSDIHPLWASLSRAGNKTIAMPVDSDVLLLYYRRDTLDAFNMSVPVTWAQLADLAAAWNARVRTVPPTAAAPASSSSVTFPAPASQLTAAPPAAPPSNSTASGLAAPLPRYGLCLNDAAVCTSSTLLSAILASITQQWGPQTGWAVDLQQLNPDVAVRELVNGTAMYLALQTYSSLAAQSPSGLECQQTLSMFAQGDCLMTINWGRQFKALQAADVPVRGLVGITLTPGSSQIFDRTQGVLVPAGPDACSDPVQSASTTGTSTSTTPTGSSSASSSNSSTWGCRAPMLAYGGTFGVIGLRNNATYQQLAFQFLSHLTSSAAQWDGLLDPSSPVEPVRVSMMQQGAEAMLAGLEDRLVPGYGDFDPRDAKAYLAAMREAFSSPNVGVELGAPGSFELRLSMESAITAYLQGAGAAGVADDMVRDWLDEWSRLGYSSAQVVAIMRGAIPPGNDTEQGETDTVRRKATRWGIAVGVSCGIGLPAVVAFLTLCWCKRRRARQALLRRIIAPTLGAETSLVVTDIQDSTKFWEVLSSDVMDYAIYHHHSLARRLMLQFQGYESATEGDSFIIAFQTADDAVCFCALFQQELLLVPWPPELLMLEGCKPVWMCRSMAEAPRRDIQQPPQLEVTRSAAPLSPFTLSAMSGAANSGSYHSGVRRGLHVGPTAARGDAAVAGGLASIPGAATYTSPSPSIAGGAIGQFGSVSHTYMGPYSVQAAAQQQHQHQQDMNPPPALSAPTVATAAVASGAVLPRFARGTASFATPGSPGTIGSIGALGASPRQMSFLGRSASRLGMTSNPAVVTTTMSTVSSAVVSGLNAAGGGGGTGGGTERAPVNPSQGEARGADDGFLPAPLAFQGNPTTSSVQPDAGPSDGGDGEGDGGGFSNDAAAARAGLEAGGVMSFRESFRAASDEPLQRRRSSSEGDALGLLPADATDAPKVPTLTGAAVVISESGAASGAKRCGSGGGGSGSNAALTQCGAPPSRSRSLARSVSMMGMSCGLDFRTGNDGGDDMPGFGPTGPSRSVGPMSCDGVTAMARIDRSENGRLTDRPTPTSKSSDIRTVSEFNTVLESCGGDAYMRPSELGVHVSPPGTSIGSVCMATGFPQPPLPPRRQEALQPTCANPGSEAEAQPLDSGTRSPATRSTGPLAEGVGQLTTPGSLVSPPYSPRAVVQRVSVHFGFPSASASAAATGSVAGTGGHAACSSGDEAWASAGGAGGGNGASTSMPTPRLAGPQAPVSPPHMDTGTSAGADAGDGGLSGTMAHSQVSYNSSSPSASRGSPPRAPPLSATPRASRYLHSSCSGVQDNPDTSPPVPLSCRAASRRRCSDITGTAGFAEYAAQYSPVVTTGSIHGASQHSPTLSQSPCHSISTVHESGLRPSPLGRGSTQIAAGRSYRSRIQGSSGGGSDGVGGGRSSNSRSLRGPSVDGAEATYRGHSSPLPGVFSEEALPEEEDRVPMDVPSCGAEGESSIALARDEAATTAATAASDGPSPDGTASVPLNPFRLGRRSNLPVAFKRSMTTAQAHASAAGAIVIGTSHSALRSGGGGPSSSTPRATAAAAAMASSTSASRGIFGLVGLPSPRPGGTGLLGLGMGLSHTLHAVESRAGSMASMMRLASQQNLQSVGDSLCSRWRVVEERENGAQLVFRGLRVRMGVHSGLSEECDAVQLNRTANRTQYTGLGLQMAKAVCDCAHGGQVLMSEAAFTQLAVEGLKERVMVLHMGEHRMRNELPATSIYCGCPRALQGRIPTLRTVRSQQQHSLGVLEAPAGLVVVVFMHVVGAMSLLDWRADLAHTALGLFRDHVSLELIKHQGYLVEAVDGLVLASFSSPAAGLRWVVKCQHDMTMLPWPQELLSHEACEELCTTRVNPLTGVQEEVVLFRGLRLKAGVDMGRLRGEINCITGRMSYRGRAMNRAARIVATAGSGQILASSDVWRASSAQAAARMYNLTAVSLGQFNLKGVSEPIEVFQIKTASDIFSKRSRAVLSSVEDPLELDELPIADPTAALHHHAAINNAASSAAAAAAAAVLASGAAGGPAGALAARVGSISAGMGAGGAGGSTSLPARMMLERVQSMTGGLAAVLRREESASRGARGNLSRQLSRNVSVSRSRRSSRRSSVGSQYSALATNTMVALARGSYDGRLDVVSPVRSGVVQHVAVTAAPGPAGTTSAPQGAYAAAGMTSLYTNAPGSQANTQGALATAGAHAGGGGGGGGGGVSSLPYGTNLAHGSNLPASIGSGTRTSRNSTAEQMDTDGNRSSNQRSSNPSIRSIGVPRQGSSSVHHAQLHSQPPYGSAHTGAGSPVLSRTGAAQGLVRHISTLIRSASNALYGSSGNNNNSNNGGGAGGAAAGVISSGPFHGAGSQPLSPRQQSQSQIPSLGVALSPTLETTYETGDSGGGAGGGEIGGYRRRPSGERGVYEMAAGAAGTAAPAAGLPSVGSPTGAPAAGSGGHGGGGGGVLRDLLAPRLRAAGSLFRVGSFSGHVRRRAEDGNRASDYDYFSTDRRNRSPPGRRLASTVSGLRYVAATGGGPVGVTSGLPSSPESTLMRAPSRRRSVVDPSRPRSATVDRATAGTGTGTGTAASGAAGAARTSLSGLLEGPEAGENSFVIVVGEDDQEEQEQEDQEQEQDEAFQRPMARVEWSRGGRGGSLRGGVGPGAGSSAGHVGGSLHGSREANHATISRLFASAGLSGNAGQQQQLQQQQSGVIVSATVARWELGGPVGNSGGDGGAGAPAAGS
ncbi:hypothetical protein Agub_g1232 [Astrephomene gubernaculifera]|uniref:Guanylate cyclase domain-containing protein n=1 Tax=Astrephomene gubernaculifera TaxID=47775 RepID=A0AAD3DHR8_9CHLO|nr:hypothetical protein Agub_g1232 [Astrephomene gubernaculifera]